MRDCIFQKGTEVTVIRINGHNITFNQVVGNTPMFTTIEGLKLNPATIVEQFPDLKGEPIGKIKSEGVKRFKDKVKTFKTEEEIQKYLQEDLRKHGFILKMIHRKGWRPEIVKDNGCK
jgi:hypothetical protein